MILDSYKLNSVTFQISYEGAFVLWDRAGEIARRLCKIWPDLKLVRGTPDKQILKCRDVNIQTSFERATVTLRGEKSLSQGRIRQLGDTFEVWRELLELTKMSRVSTFSSYVREFSSIKEANSELIGLSMVRWPEQKIFDQPLDSESNSLEVFYRFEDKESFSTVRINAQQAIFTAELDPDFIDDSEIKKTKNRMFINFDRGMLGSVDAEKFRVDSWIKGYQHILRRDIEKLIGS